MSASTNAALGIAFLILAIFATILQARLWRFPMGPDPTGRDPNGVSTAPRLWTNVHRLMGYSYAVIYVILMTQMVPRLWNYEVLTAMNWVHIFFGILIGPVLIFKIAIIRKIKRLGKRLPWFGGTLCASTIILIGLVIGPALRISSGPAMPGKEVAVNKCVSCHGSSLPMSEGRTPIAWQEVAHEMHDIAEDKGRPLSEQEAALAADYLSVVRPGNGGSDIDGEGERGRDRERRPEPSTRDQEHREEPEEASGSGGGRGRGRGRGGRE